MKSTLLFLSLAASAFAFDQNEAVAAVIVGEAGGEGKIGMQAVASVIQNRMKGKSAFDVVSRKYQFSIANHVTVQRLETWDEFVARAKRHPRYNVALEMAKEIANKKLPDVTNGSTHYFAYKKVLPYWAEKLVYKTTIGNHSFYFEGSRS